MGFNGHVQSALGFVLTFALLGSFAQPDACAKKAIDWDKELASGTHQMEIGELDKAIEMFDKKVKKYPDSGAAHTALGMALKKKGKFSQAKAEFQTATRSDSSYPNAFYELGAMQQGDNEYSQAAQSFERFLQLAPASDRRGAVADRIRFCKEKS